MGKFGHMQSFTNAACEYTKQPNEVITAALIKRNLEVISKSVDETIFEPDTAISTAFYASLHKLLRNANSESIFSWVALDVIQKACRNIAARHALIHSYKFAPILLNFLKPFSEDGIDLQKHEQVLTLLEELTSGIQMSWEEVSLDYLIITLAQWVEESKHERIVNLCIGVFANVCLNNKPIAHKFAQLVNMQNFSNRVGMLGGTDDIDIKIQCLRFILTMKGVKKKFTDNIPGNYAGLVFEGIISAIAKRSAASLKHAVHLFVDYKNDNRCCGRLCDYESYGRDVRKIMKLLRKDTAQHGINFEYDFEFLEGVIDFLISLFDCKSINLSSLYDELMKEAIPWISVNRVGSKSLALIKTVLRHKDSSESMTDSTSSSISFDSHSISAILLTLTVKEEIEGNKPPSRELIEKFSEVSQVLELLAMDKTLRVLIVQKLKPEAIKKMLTCVLKFKEQGTKDDKFDVNLYGSFSSMFVHALSLVANLSAHHSDWAEFYNELLQMKQVHLMLAHALFIGDGMVKKKIFRLAADQNFCTSNMIECMKELEPSLLLQGTATEK